MSIYTLMNQSPNNWYYSTREKLYEYAENKVLDKIRKSKEVRALINTTKKHKEYAELMRKKFVENLGILPYDHDYPLNEKVVGVINEDELTIEKVIFESRKNVYITANVYVPKNRSKKSGAVLFVIGHAHDGKFCNQYQKVARRIAKQGLIVLVYDPTGQGERLNYCEENIEKPMVSAAVCDHIYFGNQCLLTGDSPAGYFIADAMRAVDYLESREDVDSEKVGITGSSGGGTLTCHMMICDSRIKAAAPGTFFTSRDEYIKAHLAQDAEQIWLNSLCYGFDFHEILGCFAPKPCMILAVEYDFFLIEGAEEVVDECRRFWKMYGSDELYFVTDKSVHAYTDVLAENAAQFFKKVFDADYENKIRYDISLSQNDLNCTNSGQVSFDFEDAVNMYEENKKRYEKISGILNNSLNEFLKERMYFEREKINIHLKFFSDPLYEHGLKFVPMMWFSQKALPNYAYLITEFKTEKIDDMYVILTDNGTKDIEKNIYKVRKALKNHDAVLVADFSGIGQNETLGDHDQNARDAYGYFYNINMNLMLCGDSIAALHLFELDTMVKIIGQYYTEKISIYSEGRMANIAELYSKINFDIKFTFGDYESYKEIVENKYYEGSNFAKILLPGIIKYL